MLRRIAALTASLLAAAALTAGAATAASAAARDTQANAGTLVANTPCQEWFQNSYGGGNQQFLHAVSTSPHRLWAGATEGLFCEITVNANADLYLIQSHGTNLCLSVQSDHSVDEATCNTNDSSQVVHFIFLQAGGDSSVELQFVNKTADCIYQDGRDSPVDVAGCNLNNTGDVWITNF